ncbi:MAG: hypothetical protein EOP88_08640 [Verrucomicrobiaceae bacterium]|nr:MAG: hypothetical protein EOP88_08640 [Verrucomicrobiaceae bacterium]
MKSILLLLVKWSCILGFLGLGSCATRGPLLPVRNETEARRELSDRIAVRPEPAILFVGNSYSFGVPKAFSKAAALRGKKVRTGHATYGGWTLARHAENEATLNKIRNGRWDIVVIQEQSRIPAMPPRKRAAEMFPPLRLLVAEARKQGAVPVLYQTWGRRDGDPDLRKDDFLAMTRRLREGYQAAAKDAGGLVIIPVGDAWEREWSAGKGSALFMEDGSHPTQAGNDLTGRTFADVFFGP